jgi:hypothetical protein
MSKVVHIICDGCKATENDTVPKTWYTIKEGKETEHYCTVACLLRVFMQKGKHEEEEQKKEAKKEARTSA